MFKIKNKAPLVYIDPGHGGHDPGALSPHGIPHEKDIVLAVGLILKTVLKREGFRVKMSRKTDVYLSPGERARRANGKNADIFVSIHCNSNEGRPGEGIETFHYPLSSSSQNLANKIQDTLVRKFSRNRNRGVKTSSVLSVLKVSAMPAVLVELEFINHPERYKDLKDPRVQIKYAEAIAEGISDYFESIK